MSTDILDVNVTSTSDDGSHNPPKPCRHRTTKPARPVKPRCWLGSRTQQPCNAALTARDKIEGKLCRLLFHLLSGGVRARPGTMDSGQFTVKLSGQFSFANDSGFLARFPSTAGV